MFKLNIFIIYFLSFLIINGFCENFKKVFFVSDNSVDCVKYAEGIKSDKRIVFVNTPDKCNVIVTCGNIPMKTVSSFKKPVLIGLSEEYILNNNKCKNCILLKYPLFKDQMKKISEFFQNKKLTVGIILHNPKMIKYLKSLKLKNLKIFQVKNSYKIPYIVNRAVTASDCILLYPDNLLFKKIILEFIIKKIILSGKLYIAYSDYFLNYGATLVFENNYYKDGQKTAELIISKKLGKKKIISETVSVKINRRYISQ